MSLKSLLAGKATTANLEKTLADLDRRLVSLGARHAQAQTEHQRAVETRRAVLLSEEMAEGSVKKAEAAVRQAASELEGLTDALDHLRAERIRLEGALAEARDRERREAEAKQCEQRAVLVEAALKQAAEGAKQIDAARTDLAQVLDSRDLGLAESGPSAVPAAHLCELVLAAGLRRAAECFAPCTAGGFSIAEALQQDRRFFSGELADAVLPPGYREHLPTLDLAVPERLRQRAAELRAAPATAQVDHAARGEPEGASRAGPAGAVA